MQRRGISVYPTQEVGPELDPVHQKGGDREKARAAGLARPTIMAVG